MDDFIKELNKYCFLSDKTRSSVKERAEVRQVKKTDILVKESEVCRELYWVKSGVLRGYSKINNKEITLWFSVHGDFAASMSSFITQTPGNQYIEVLEDSELFVLSYAKLQELYRIAPEMNKVGRLITEQIYLNLEYKAYTQNSLTPRGRYNVFAKRYPQLPKKIPPAYIASYLGIPESGLEHILSLK